MKLIAAIMAFTIFLIPFSSACKDVIVTNDFTKGEYNLLMKIRDPSRPGLQVLFIANKGCEFSYHNPWNNEPWIFRLNHKIIGVATKGDTPPNMIKAGMMMSDAGIAYGDADCPTLYINPTKHAWDDFDWLLYSAENASNEEDAIKRLKEVSDMHAVGIGENLFIVGPKKAYVIEADAFHFIEKEIKGKYVMSNYPKMLWNKRLAKKIIASSFDQTYEGYVKKWQVVRLGGLIGIRIVKIGDNWIMVRAIPFGKKIKIDEGEGSKVGNFWVELIKSEGKRARIKVCYEYYEWENIIKNMLNESIDVRDLMKISRLTKDDLNGLRGLTEGEEKATMIFKIPLKGYEKLSMGWFAPDAIVAIFIPVHIADDEIYDAYENGNAAEISLDLLQKFGSIDFSNIEEVFINENDAIEKIAMKNYDKSSYILTCSDKSMQKQAIMIEKFWIYSNDVDKEKLIKIWNKSYYKTICNMEKNINKVGKNLKELFSSIALTMCEARVKIEKEVNGSDYTLRYQKAKELANKGKYKESIEIIKDIFIKTDKSLFGIEHERKNEYYGTIIAVMTIVILILAMIYIKRRKKAK